MRPEHETDEDRFAEKRFADSMGPRLNSEFIKLPKYYIVDFVVKKNGKIIGFAEFKRRNNPSDKYDTIMLALAKWMKLCEYSQYGGAWFWIQYDDCLKWIKVEQSLYPSIEWSGRTDRGDPADKEPCVHIPTYLLRNIDAG